MNCCRARTIIRSAWRLPPMPARRRSRCWYRQREYEVQVALYQARNAIQIARAERVDAYAADTLGKAERLAQEAEQTPDRGKGLQ